MDRTEDQSSGSNGLFFCRSPPATRRHYITAAELILAPTPKHHHATITTTSEGVPNFQCGLLGFSSSVCWTSGPPPICHRTQYSGLSQRRQQTQSRLATLIAKGWAIRLDAKSHKRCERPDNLNSNQDISSSAKFGPPAFTSTTTMAV